MTSPSEKTGPGEVTELLLRWSDPGARDRLFAAIYPELKRVADLRMRRERADHTLQPTALVGEVFLHLVRQDSVSWQSRGHFLAVASEAMRRILVDHARIRMAQKRPHGGRISLDEIRIGSNDDFAEVLEIDDMLEKLAVKDPRAARVVELRYFGGLTFGEISGILGVNERTAKRDWQLARAWLFTELRSGDSDETDDGRTTGPD